MMAGAFFTEFSLLHPFPFKMDFPHQTKRSGISIYTKKKKQWTSENGPFVSHTKFSMQNVGDVGVNWIVLVGEVGLWSRTESVFWSLNAAAIKVTKLCVTKLNTLNWPN